MDGWMELINNQVDVWILYINRQIDIYMDGLMDVLKDQQVNTEQMVRQMKD